MAPFLKYYTRQFIGHDGRQPIFDLIDWNVHEPLREGMALTQNGAEAGNGALATATGTHPTIFRFLHAIKKVVGLTRRKLAQARPASIGLSPSEKRLASTMASLEPKTPPKLPIHIQGLEPEASSDEAATTVAAAVTAAVVAAVPEQEPVDPGYNFFVASQEALPALPASPDPEQPTSTSTLSTLKRPRTRETTPDPADIPSTSTAPLPSRSKKKKTGFSKAAFALPAEEVTMRTRLCLAHGRLGSRQNFFRIRTARLREILETHGDNPGTLELLTNLADVLSLSSPSKKKRKGPEAPPPPIPTKRSQASQPSPFNSSSQASH